MSKFIISQNDYVKFLDILLRSGYIVTISKKDDGTYDIISSDETDNEEYYNEDKMQQM